jgi:hypothetical protein
MRTKIGDFKLLGKRASDKGGDPVDFSGNGAGLDDGGQLQGIGSALKDKFCDVREKTAEALEGIKDGIKETGAAVSKAARLALLSLVAAAFTAGAVYGFLGWRRSRKSKGKAIKAAKKATKKLKERATGTVKGIAA